MFALIKSKKLKHLGKIILSGAGNVKKNATVQSNSKSFPHPGSSRYHFFSSFRGRCKNSSKGHMQNNLLEGKLCLEKYMPFSNGALNEKW